MFAFLPAVARADPAAPAFTANGRPRIGLVLSGGGAKGFAHIGVIEELERRHIPVDVISGTSMGAVVGSMYAIGNDAAQIKAIASSIDWVSVFNDRHDRRDLSFRRKREVRDILLDARLGIVDGKVALPRGVLGGQRLFATVQEILAPWRATQDFDRLPIPFRAVATDIVTGDAVAMGSGNLSTAVFASMSIPAAFPPVKRDGLLLVDGMIADNLPVDVARAMGVDVIIAVDVGQPPRASADDITNAIDVFSQMQSLLGWASIKRQRASMTGRDVLIDPDITGLSVTGFTNYALGIERGRAAARKMGDKLAALAVSDAQWAEYLAQRRARTDPSPIVIDKVRIVNTSTLPTRMLEPMITTRPGETLDGSRMARDVTAIFKLDEFERVDYSVDFGASGNTLVVNALGGRASEKYFMAGALLTTNFGKTSTFDLALGYTDRNFLGTGAEWRGFARVGNDVLLDVSLYKQFGRAFVEPIAYYQKYSSEIVRQGSQEAGGLLQVHGGGAGIDGGWVFGNWGEFRLGFRLGGINPTEQGLDIGIPPGWITDTDWRAGFTVDTLDSLNFPRSGTFAQLQFVDHIGVLGGKFRRETLGLNVQKPHSFGETTIVFGGRLGTTTRAVNDYLGDYALGGFLNMSGLRRNSLIGQQLLFGRAVAFHRISSQAPILDLPVYIGGSLEAGNVWGSTSDISLSSLRTAVSGFIAADTPLGPLWLAVGQSRSDTSVYLVLGRVF
ncbi:patatin-like phospholipase family protein [Polymorphobacter fuscus]|uniref:patatin-like phospholipase family protein n=1 Tax=Sandarakinorhabdus fusca TaxID=1439888 RepID=UPI00142FF417|nr:patatin-like phospholipase family protein [Polymorphobacter fuscus]NJC07647.1 NTE family protein [Polymorphobacter fuscus]